MAYQYFCHVGVVSDASDRYDHYRNNPGGNGSVRCKSGDTPFSTAVFFSSLNGYGTSCCYKVEIGKSRKQRADRYFGQGFIVAVGLCVLLAVLSITGKDIYFGYMNPSEEVAGYVKDYFFYYQYVIIFYPIYSFLLDMVYCDGDELIYNLSFIPQVVINIPISVVLCSKTGNYMYEGLYGSSCLFRTGEFSWDSGSMDKLWDCTPYYVRNFCFVFSYPLREEKISASFR